MVPAAQSAPPTTGQTFAERIVDLTDAAWRHLLSLNAREAGVNFLLSAGVVLLALGAIWILRRLFDRLFARVAKDCAPEETPQLERTTPRAAGVTWVLLRLAILVGALLWVATVWGVDPWAWLTGEAGARLIRLTLIVVLVSALVEVSGFVIRRCIEGFAVRSREVRRAAQIRTLGPLLIGSVQGVLMVVGLLTFLSELGVKVGPLLASAGVVGIAVGFGAQTLVKDFLTGLFLIMEDVVSVGDEVRIDDVSGSVEAMTLRTIRLRSTNGTLHIFPYSEAQVIHNRTKVFSSYLFEVTVAYSTDLDRALAIMEDVGRELTSDAAFRRQIIRPFEVLGVDKLTESGVVLKARITTEPRAQLKIGRAYNHRIKSAFDAAGVSTPFTSVQILPGPGARGEDDDRQEPRSFAPPQGEERSA